MTHIINNIPKYTKYLLKYFSWRKGPVEAEVPEAWRHRHGPWGSGWLRDALSESCFLCADADHAG